MQPLSAQLAQLRARRIGSQANLRGSVGQTLALGFAVALATWFVSLNDPAPGLDPSWLSGLYMAVHDGIPFGTDVVFTYGPLGFLINSVGWFSDLQAIAFVWLALLHVAFASALVWALRRSVGAIAAVLIAFVVIALLQAVEVPFALAAIACFAVLQRDRPRHSIEALVVGGAAFAAVEVLVKLSVGPPVFVIFALALIGARARPWQLGLYVALFGACVLGLWLASGQALGDLPDYVTNGRQIISGYSEAMILTKGTALQHTLGVIAALIGLTGLVAGAALASYRDPRARWCAVAVAALAGFALFKEGVVRFDAPHLSAYFATIAVIWLAIPWSAARRVIPAFGALVLIAIAGSLQLHKDPGQAWDLLNAVDNVDRAYTETKSLFDPTQRAAEAEWVRTFMVLGYALDDEMLGELEGQTVAIDPWEIAVAWAYDFDWSPLPVIQNYSAYTAELDRLNASRVASPDGPDRILRENPAELLAEYPTRGIDDRYPAWDPPEQALATLCNFEILQTTVRWQLLGRVPDRCGEPQSLGSVDSAYGESVEVPQPGPGEVVFVRIHGAEVSGLESLRSLLYRASFRYAVVNGDRSYNLIPGTAAGRLLLAGGPDLVGVGPFAQAPQAQTLELNGPSGDLRYDFFSMAVSGASSAGNGGG